MAELSTYDNKTIRELALEVIRDYQAKNKQMPYVMAPYVEAMLSLESIGDKYYLDSGDDIVLRFLSNAGGWRGEVARGVKAALKKKLNKNSI
jgi:hypothetical protein